MKSLEYRIWARSFTKNSVVKDYVALCKTREQMRTIRSIRFDKECKRKQ
jgi:hypothetical protein